jgi:hypothetical protein
MMRIPGRSLAPFIVGALSPAIVWAGGVPTTVIEEVVASAGLISIPWSRERCE